MRIFSRIPYFKTISLYQCTLIQIQEVSTSPVITFSNVKLQALQKSKFIKPLTLFYDQNGISRKSELFTIHNGVVIILYNITRNILVFVKQFRPSVYVANIPLEDRKDIIDTEKYPASLGLTIEFCAGIIDKSLPLAEIAAEEVLEECGYKVDANQLEKVSSYKANVGNTGSLHSLFYCELTDDMKVNDGGGVANEPIEVIEMTISEVQKYLKQDVVPSPPGFMYGMQWFLTKMNVTNF